MLDFEIIIFLLAGGCFAGFMAGLLGVGGGQIIVPILVWTLHYLRLGGEYVQHLAVGTSLAVMIFTSFSNVLAQQKLQSIRWDVVKVLAPAMIMGTFLGSSVAGFISGLYLRWFFVVFIYIIAFRTVFSNPPKASRQFPGLFGGTITGIIIGMVSSWVGIGGGSLIIPFLVWCNLPMRNAIGTSATLGWPIAFAGAIGYIYSGYSVQGLPEMTLGFVYLPAAFILIIATMIFAPLGVKVAHYLSAQKLKIIFSCLLFVMGTQMLWSLISEK